MHRNAAFPLVNMEMEAFTENITGNIEQKDGDEAFVKNISYWYVAYNFIKRNEILQPKTLIYFKAIFNVIQRTIIVR